MRLLKISLTNERKQTFDSSVVPVRGGAVAGGVLAVLALVAANFGDDDVDSLDEVTIFSGNLIFVVLVRVGFKLLGSFSVVSANFVEVEVSSEFILLVTVVISRLSSCTTSACDGVAAFLSSKANLSALASIISRPALIKSKKLFSVDGRALKGCRVVTSIMLLCFSVLTSSSCGSSDPNSNEKKSMSSSGSSSLFCRTCRVSFNDRLQS